MFGSMRAYILARSVQLLPVLLVVIVLNFVLVRMAPGDPTYYLIGEATVSPEYVANLRAQLGLDQPMHQQLLIYLGQVAHGDLGFSYISRAPVTSVILIICYSPQPLISSCCRMSQMSSFPSLRNSGPFTWKVSHGFLHPVGA